MDLIRRSEDHTRVLRQKVVSSAKLRGMRPADIAAFLVEQGIVNPRTREPWSVATIISDLKSLEDDWKDDASKSISDHRVRILAEIGEAKRAAWKTGNIGLVLRAIDQEVSLLGLNELERMSTEIALANLFKGFPKEVSDKLKRLLADKLDRKKKRLVSSNTPTDFDVSTGKGNN